MIARFRSILLAVALLLAFVVAIPADAAPPGGPGGSGGRPRANKVILFAADGMRPDLMEGYAAAASAEGFPALPLDAFLLQYVPNVLIALVATMVGAYARLRRI